MAEQPDLSLPERVPEMEPHHDQPMGILPFAFYTLCDLSSERVESYRRLCATDCEDDTVRLPPKANFDGDSLRSIVKYHVELGAGGEFDRVYFIVSVFVESTAVLLVTLDDDDLECKPDLMWINMDESGLAAVNLQIGNTDWFEAKEGDLGGPQWPPTDDDDRDEDDTQENAESHRTADSTSGDGGYGSAPPVGFHIQLYVVEGVDSEALLNKIEPSSKLKREAGDDFACKVFLLPMEGSSNALRRAGDLHPLRCAQCPTLQRHYFLVADERDYLEQGVELVNLRWDGEIVNRTQEELRRIGQEATFQSQRAEVMENTDTAAVGLLCMICQGYQKWAPRHKQFGLYTTYGEGETGTQIALAIDPRWAKRGHGEERVDPGCTMRPQETESTGRLWPAILSNHAAYCERRKFVTYFVRQYLIWCADPVPSSTSEVQLVKLDWDGDLQSFQALLEDYESKISIMRVVASEAHKTLTDVVEGKVSWSGVSLASSA